MFVSFIVALVIGPLCVILYGETSSKDEILRFLGLSFVALASGTTALLTARTRWRWLLLLLLLPISFDIAERAWELWSWSHHQGILPYFLFLFPSAVVSLALWCFARWLTRTWRPSGLLCWQNIARAGLHALPFALVFAPAWQKYGDFSFLIPASSFLFIPGFGGLFGSPPPNGRGIIIAAASLGTLWVLFALFFLRYRTQPLTQETENS